MMMARRLCESGCGFVTVTNTGWDMHGNAFGIDDGMPILGPAVDKAVSAFIEDCEHRGLSEKILLVITGEFGRTPRINKNAGRDHWPQVSCAFMAGGGMRHGQVIGASDKHAAEPAERPVHMGEVHATLYQAMGINPNATTVTDLTGRPQYLVDGWQPMKELI